MPKTTSEQNLENAIVADLVKFNQFHTAEPEDYDRPESRIVKRVRSVIEKKGTLHVLRKGVDESASGG